MSDMQPQINKMQRDVRLLAIAMIVLAVTSFFNLVKGAEFETVPTPREVVGWMLSDAAQLEPHQRPDQIYAWVPAWGSPDWIGAMDFAINTAVSHSGVLHKSERLANGWLLRYDLCRLVPNPKQREKTRAVLDQLVLEEPYFHVVAKNVAVAAVASIVAPVAAQRLPNGQIAQPTPPQAKPIVTAADVRKPVLAPHLQVDQALAASALTNSGVYLFRADWLLFRTLSTLEGGKYYDLQQIERKPEKGTAQQAWLATYGVFENDTQRLNGDSRAAMFRSLVTGKPRRVDVFQGLGKGSLVSITHDASDDQQNVANHPIYNLLDFKDAAREAIVQRPNGLHAFALFDAQGNLQDEVPPNVAKDHTIPAPHTARLQSAISCIRCHAADDGWKPFPNDVAKILASGIDVFSDVAKAAKITREEVIDRLASLYAGDLEGPDSPLGRGRRDYGSAVFRLVGGPRLGEESKPLSAVAKVSETVGRIYGQYRYDLVTPEQAAIELGYKNTTLAEVLGEGVKGESIDPVIGTLRAGISVNRFDWEPVYADAALLAQSVNKACGDE